MSHEHQQGERPQQRPARKADSIELRLASSEQCKTANDQQAITREKLELINEYQ